MLVDYQGPFPSDPAAEARNYIAQFKRDMQLFVDNWEHESRRGFNLMGDGPSDPSLHDRPEKQQKVDRESPHGETQETAERMQLGHEFHDRDIPGHEIAMRESDCIERLIDLGRSASN